MIIVMEAGASKNLVTAVIDKVKQLGYLPHPIYGTERTVVAAVGDKRGKAELQVLDVMPGVEKVVPILQPFKLAGREFRGENTVIKVKDVEIGGDSLVIIAGPCSVEDRNQMLESAQAVKEAGAKMLRGGAFKPRTSPYSFHGLGEEGLELLAEAREITGLPIVTELMDSHDLELVSKYTDVIQIGARNMQNYGLLSRLKDVNNPILLKRGMMSTIRELLLSAEYILSGENYNVMICERGIRTFETETRNTFDINAIPVLKKYSHLPIIADPSHGTGRWEYVPAVSKAAIAAGADGLLIEVHPHPEQALSDGVQSLLPEKFAKMIEGLKPIAEAVGKKI